MTELNEKWQVNLAYDSDFHVNRRDLLHAANLRHWTDGFTSPPKEGMVWIISTEKSDGTAGFEPTIRVLVGKPEGRRPLERPRRRWENNIKMDLQEVCWTRLIWLSIWTGCGHL
jgi:hypothetical protein